MVLNHAAQRAYGEAEFWMSVIKIMAILGLILLGSALVQLSDDVPHELMLCRSHHHLRWRCRLGPYWLQVSSFGLDYYIAHSTRSTYAGTGGTPSVMICFGHWLQIRDADSSQFVGSI